MRVWLWAVAASAVLSVPTALMPFQRDFYRRHFPAEFNSWTNNGTFSLVDTFHMAEDTYPYAARINHSGSHVLPGDPYIKENASKRLVSRDFIPFFTLGKLHRVLGGDIRRTWAWLYFLVPILWVVLLYHLMVRFGAGREPALFFAVLSTLFEDLTRTIPGFGVEAAQAAVQYAFWFMGSYQHWLGPTRILRPLVIYPFLFGAVLVFAWACGKRTMAAAIAAGLAAGGLAYVHPDVWAAFGGALAFFIAHDLWRTRKLSPFLLVLGGAAAAACAPWILLNRGAMQEDVGIVAQAARTADWTALPYLALAWLCWSRWRENTVALWTAGLFVTVAAGLNGQLLGFQGNPSLWVYLGNTFAVLALGRWLSVKIWSWRWMTALLLALALPRSISYSVLHYKIYALPAAQEQALSWLKENAPEDSVVAALSPMTVSRIPVHTRSKTLASLIFPLTSDISIKENAQRLARSLALFGAKPAALAKECLDESGRWEKRLWLGQVDEASRERSGLCLRYFFTDAEMFSRLVREAPPGNFTVDYLWLGPFEKALADPALFKGRRKLYENAAVAIYKP